MGSIRQMKLVPPREEISSVQYWPISICMRMTIWRASNTRAKQNATTSKSRLLEFGRYAKEGSEEEKPETFDFLGFTFYFGENQAGKYCVKPKTNGKRLANKVKELKQWLKYNKCYYEESYAGKSYVRFWKGIYIAKCVFTKQRGKLKIKVVFHMKPKIRTPFFEVGIKNYLYGDQVLELARAADAAAQKYDIDVLFLAPYTEIRRVAENTERLIVFAPYMDTLRPGRGMADVLPEAVKAAGAQGVVINHCERPMTLTAIRSTIARADELDLITFVCADTIGEAKALAQLHPDIINPEPADLIGTGKISDLSFVQQSIRAVKDIYQDILVEQAAGISSGEQVYRTICAGAEGVGAASGVCTAADPCKMVEEMIRGVRMAYDEIVAGNQI